MFKLPRLVSPCLALVALTVATDVRADDSCSLSDVLQPAIDSAADESSCNADGVYLSGDVFTEAIALKCNKSKNIERCRKCVKEEREKTLELVKALLKQGIFERSNASAVKTALDGILKTNCGALPPIKPTATPTPTATPGDEDEEPGPGQTPPPGSTPPSTSTPPPTGTPKAPEEIGAQLQLACPCRGQFSSREAYLQCATSFLGGKVTAGKITKEKAYEIYFYVQKNTCGVPAPTGGVK